MYRERNPAQHQERNNLFLDDEWESEQIDADGQECPQDKQRLRERIRHEDKDRNPPYRRILPDGEIDGREDEGARQYKQHLIRTEQA